MRVVLRGHEPRWLAPASLVAAVLVTLALTAIPIRLAGANPMAAFERYLITPLTSVAGVHEVLLTATPLLFTGMAVAIAFRAGYWNIGAEGQFLLGAIGTSKDGCVALNRYEVMLEETLNTALLTKLVESLAVFGHAKHDGHTSGKVDRDGRIGGISRVV